MNTSFSALDTFETCPLKYKFQQIDKIKTPKSPEAVFGSLVHSTLRFVHDGGFLLPTQKQALQHFSTNWNAEIFKDKIAERMAFAQGIKIIQDYFNKNDPAKIQIVDLESRFTLDLQDEEKQEIHLISGFIDRIDKTDTGYEIIDYKTARKLPAQKNVDENLQLLIYLLAFLKRYPKELENLDKIKLSLYFVKHGVKLSTTKTRQQLEEGKKNILALIGNIQNSDYAPQVCALCDWCGFQKYCPMWIHKFKEKTSASQEEKQLIIDEYICLQENLKSHRQKITALQEKIIEIMFDEKVERLFGASGKIISKSVRKSYKYDEAKIKEILEPLGLWVSALKLDAIRLKKIIETLPAPLQKSVLESQILAKETFSLTLKKDNLQEEFDEETN